MFSPRFYFLLGLVLVGVQCLPTLRGIWLNFPPCQKLNNLSASFPEANVIIDCPDFSSWYTSAFKALKGAIGKNSTHCTAGNASVPYDFAILDSQWVRLLCTAHNVSSGKRYQTN